MRRCPLVVIVVALAFSGDARAHVDDTPAYTEAVAAGVSEFAEKNFLEARARFLQAHKLYPNARTFRALGMVSFELKNYVACVRYLSQALDSAERRLEGEKRQQAEKLLRDARGYVARVTLEFAPGTSVTVDGASKDLGPGGELLLDVGDHKLEFHADGRMTELRTLTVQGGEQRTLRVKLVPVRRADAPAPSGAPPKQERRAHKNPWLWTALGLVVAGAGVGAALALTRRNDDRQPAQANNSSGVTLSWGGP